MLKRSPIKKTQSKLKSKPLAKGQSTLKKAGKLKSKPMTQEAKEIAQMTRDADRRFCIELWNKRQPYSEISKEWLGIESNWACVHHIYAKSKYPVYRYDVENCILLTITEHAQVEQSQNYYPEINKRREQLKIKYEL